MTDEQIRNIVKTTLTFGFAAGAQWMASDKSADSCTAAINEVFDENIEFITALINSTPNEEYSETQQERFEMGQGPTKRGDPGHHDNDMGM